MYICFYLFLYPYVPIPKHAILQGYDNYKLYVKSDANPY